MAGLETIALAVAHLEREGEISKSRIAAESLEEKSGVKSSVDEKDLCRNEVDAPSKGNMGERIPTTLPPSLAMPPPSLAMPTPSLAMPPPRRGFEETTPRRVSSDSNCTDDTASFQPSASVSPALQFPTSATPSPATFASDLSSYLSDPEPDTPPPPPPSPSEVITQVMESDVLCGRGGETNHHPGNITYRALVKRFQPLYIISKRRDKPRIAEKIVRTVRQRGGRFLKKDSNSSSWKDVGNTKAREKTSQALREGAPELRSTAPKGKEEQGSQAIIVNNFPNNVASSNVLPTSTQSFPTVVKTEPSDVVGFGFVSPLSKRRRMNIPEYPTSVTIPTVPLPRSMEGIVTTYQQPEFRRYCLPSPAAFAATVSADDDEDVRPGEQQDEQSGVEQSSSARGPRLKLLKKRLQHETN